jgi:hypothetical protein
MESLANRHHNGDPYIWGNPKSGDVPVPAGDVRSPAISSGAGEVGPAEGGPVAV